MEVKVTTDFREKVLCPAGSQNSQRTTLDRQSVPQEESFQARFIAVLESEFLALKFEKIHLMFYHCKIVAKWMLTVIFNSSVALLGQRIQGNLSI